MSSKVIFRRICGVGDIVSTLFGNHNLLCPSVWGWSGRDSPDPQDGQVTVSVTLCVLEDGWHSGLVLLVLALEGKLGCLREAHT